MSFVVAIPEDGPEQDRRPVRRGSGFHLHWVNEWSWLLTSEETKFAGSYLIPVSQFSKIIHPGPGLLPELRWEEIFNVQLEAEVSGLVSALSVCISPSADFHYGLFSSTGLLASACRFLFLE